MTKAAIIFGASGQMGWYLRELLISKDYRVVCPEFRFENSGFLPYLEDLFKYEHPDEVYNLAGINYAPDSWITPDRFLQVNGLAVQKLLEQIKNFVPKTKFFQAGSAEVFEKASFFQAEDTNRLPANPYGLSKLLAMDLVRIYREKYGLFACTGIFFNAESPRRNEFFFAEKVAQEVVKLRRYWDSSTKLPKDRIKLGRLDARRDWGWTPEYVEVAWRMLQQNRPSDFVIGTGEVHTCQEFVIEALKSVGFDDAEENFDYYVEYDNVEEFGNRMQAVPLKAKKILGWEAKYKFKDVVRMLVEAEMKEETEVGKSTVTG